MAAAERLDSRAMASRVRVVVVGGAPGLASSALDRLRALEARWTRFSPDSDISHLNAAAGAPVLVDGSTVVLVTALVEAWRLTGGRFDPSTLPALIAAGYPASIDDPRRRTDLPGDAAPGADLALAEIDPVASTVRLPPGTALDPGGLGKGLAADLAVDHLMAAGATGALVSVGGDLAVAGAAPGGGPWSIAVDDPHRPGRTLLTLHLDHGGVATSSTLSRRLGPAGSTHHVIDPATALPAVTDVAAATVVATTAWQAEAIATGTLLGGAAQAVAYLQGHGVDGLVVTDDGHLLATPGATARPDREDRP